MENTAKRVNSEPRYKLDQAAIINGGRVIINDISQEGLFLTSSRQIRIGEKVDICWSLEEQELKLSGIVVRADDKEGFGVRLVHTAESKRQVMSLVVRLHLQGAMLKERSTIKNINVASWFSRLFQEKQAPQS
jgi:hypothetical protein